MWRTGQNVVATVFGSRYLAVVSNNGDPSTTVFTVTHRRAVNCCWLGFSPHLNPCIRCGGNVFAIPVLGGKKYGDLALDIGHESHRARTRERQRWRGPAATLNCIPALSSEEILRGTNSPLSKDAFKEGEKNGHGSQMVG